jgi:NAD-dependent dihydropyrimidine dehydrogenase PreA subunit
MPDNCIIISGAQPAEKQEMILREAGVRIKKIADVIKDGQIRCIERGSFLEGWLLSGVLYGIAAKKMRTNDSSFKTESGCDSCGICVRMCPVKNIEMVDGRPQWLHHCEQCMSCLQWCPKEAIQIDNKTQDRKRYRNPAVSRKDLIRRP